MQQFEQWLGGLPTRRLQGDACRSVLDAFPIRKTVTAYALCHVTYHYHWGLKTVHTFEIPDPELDIPLLCL